MRQQDSTVAELHFNATATLTACTFMVNEAIGGNGGGASFGAATLTACTFTDNEALRAGGAYFEGDSHANGLHLHRTIMDG